jgi:hypothetical protein
VSRPRSRRWSIDRNALRSWPGLVVGLMLASGVLYLGLLAWITLKT